MPLFPQELVDAPAQANSDIHQANRKEDDDQFAYRDAHNTDDEANAVVDAQQGIAQHATALQVSQADGNYIPLEEFTAGTTTVNSRPPLEQSSGLASSSQVNASEPAPVAKPAKTKVNPSQAASQGNLASRLEKFRFQQRNVQQGQRSSSVPELQSLQNQAHLARPRLEQPLAMQPWQNQSETGSETAPWKQVRADVDIPGLAMEPVLATSVPAASMQQDGRIAPASGPSNIPAMAQGSQAAVAEFVNAQESGRTGHTNEGMAKFIEHLRATAASDSALANGPAAQLTLSQPVPCSQPEATPTALHEQESSGVGGPTTTAGGAGPPAAAPLDGSQSESSKAAAIPLPESLSGQQTFEREAGRKRALPPTDFEHDALYKKARSATASPPRLPDLLPVVEDKEASQGRSYS